MGAATGDGGCTWTISSDAAAGDWAGTGSCEVFAPTPTLRENGIAWRTVGVTGREPDYLEQVERTGMVDGHIMLPAGEGFSARPVISMDRAGIIMVDGEARESTHVVNADLEVEIDVSRFVPSEDRTDWTEYTWRCQNREVNSVGYETEPSMGEFEAAFEVTQADGRIEASPSGRLVATCEGLDRSDSLSHPDRYPTRYEDEGVTTERARKTPGTVTFVMEW